MLPNQRPHKLPPTYLQRDSFNERVLKMACCMHRFLISRPDLGIDAAENSFACSSRCGSDLPHPILIFVATKENGSACSSRCCSDLPRPILISVATKENGFACNGRGGYEVHFRFHSPLPRRKMVPPATAVAATRSAADSILRCREGEWFRLQWS